MGVSCINLVPQPTLEEEFCQVLCCCHSLPSERLLGEGQCHCYYTARIHILHTISVFIHLCKGIEMPASSSQSTVEVFDLLDCFVRPEDFIVLLGILHKRSTEF